MWKAIVVLIPLLFMIKVVDSEAPSDKYDEEEGSCELNLRNNETVCCFKEGHICNPIFNCQCCFKKNVQDGPNDRLPYAAVGYYCKPNDAPDGSEASSLGCCQRCTSEGEGCTSDETPCCNDHKKVTDPSCPQGQTKCKRSQIMYCLVYRYGYVGENHICNKYKFCSVGLVCNKYETTKATSDGVCIKEEGYTGTLPPNPSKIKRKSLGKPLFESCSADVLTTTRATTTITTTTITTTPIVPTTETQDESECRVEGDYCDSGVCCENLQCPDNYCIIKIIRRVLNYFGLWYRVCRNYSAFAKIYFNY